MKKCFYEDGLRFECQRCLYCCSAEPGYVYLTRADIINASNATGLDPLSFIKVYCRLIDFGAFSMVSLREKTNFDCIFLTEEGCSIYSARPSQCTTYPFWKNIIESKESWEKEAKSCPGIGKGQVVSSSEIDRLCSEGDEAYIVLKGKPIWRTDD